MSEEEKIALFDAFLKGELSAQDKADFNTLLEKNEDFRLSFEDYQLISDQIKKGEEYRLIKHSLMEIHAATQKTHSKILKLKFIIPIISAAAIVILMYTIFPMGSNGDTAHATENSEGDYSPTDNEGEASEMSEETEVADSTLDEFEIDEQNFNQSESQDQLDEMVSVTESIPLGTSFQISENGYFITAKHLVHKKRYVILQNKDQNLAFYTEVIYRDTLTDFALLKCSDSVANLLKPCPYKIKTMTPQLGDEVFTIGYPKADIVYTKGSVSSSKGYRSDSLTFELSMASNPGNSGAPLFSKNGNLMGFIIANNSKKQSVTYVVQPSYIHKRLQQLDERFDIDMSKNYSKNSQKPSYLIGKFSPFVFELK